MVVQFKRIICFISFIAFSPAQVSGVEDERSSVKQTELLLGRCSYSASSNGYLEAHYDDIIVINPTADQSQPGASVLHGDPSRFISHNGVFNMLHGNIQVILPITN